MLSFTDLLSQQYIHFEPVRIDEHGCPLIYTWSMQGSNVKHIAYGSCAYTNAREHLVIVDEASTLTEEQWLDMERLLQEAESQNRVEIIGQRKPVRIPVV